MCRMIFLTLLFLPLHSWHLWGVLNALEYVHMHPTREAQLHTSFATQLEASGLWQWAIFVLLHLDDPAHCKSAVRGVLSRQCSESEELTEREVFVSETLHVPPQWVHEAKVRLICLPFSLSANSSLST